VRVQKHSVQPEYLHLRVELLIAVLLVACYGMAGVLRVYANLVGAPGEERDLHESRQLAEELHRPELAERRLAGRIGPHRPLTADAQVGAQGYIDTLAAQVPFPFDQGEVAFLEPAIAKKGVHGPQGTGVSRDQEYTAGVTVKAMNQLEGLTGSQSTQPLDDTEAHAAAAVNCNPDGLLITSRLSSSCTMEARIVSSSCAEG